MPNIQGTVRMLNPINGVVGGAGGYSLVDDALSTTSKNPVQNKVITTALNQRTALIASEYSSSATYNAGDYCIHNNTLYRSIYAITVPEAFNISHWQLVVSIGSDLEGLADVIAYDYSSDSTYDIGDYCMYNNVLYRCKSTISAPEAFNPSHWQRVSIGTVLTALANKVPNPPITNGKYTLVATVSNGTVTYSWEDFVKLWLGTTEQYEDIDPKQQDTVYILSDDMALESIEGDISQLQSDMDDIQAKSDMTILNETVMYGTGKNVSLSTGDYNISDFAAVKVDDIICSVFADPNVSAPENIRIRGTGNVGSLSIKNIDLLCNSTTNKLVSNLSMLDSAQSSISKIVGMA